MGVLADTAARRRRRGDRRDAAGADRPRDRPPRADRAQVVDSMHERKALMAELADAFVAVPGGIGTLEELIEVYTWSQLGIHDKACGVLNVKRLLRPPRGAARPRGGRGLPAPPAPRGPERGERAGRVARPARRLRAARRRRSGWSSTRPDLLARSQDHLVAAGLRRLAGRVVGVAGHEHGEDVLALVARVRPRRLDRARAARPSMTADARAGRGRGCRPRSRARSRPAGRRSPSTVKCTVSPKSNGGEGSVTVRFTTGAWLPTMIRTEADAERPVAVGHPQRGVVDAPRRCR